MRIEIKGWSSTDNCEYPVCDHDEALPVFVLLEGKEAKAWYRNPELNEFWFESDTGKELINATTWKLRD